MAKHEMDNLTWDAVAARQMGMTYGHYMAYKQIVDTHQRQTAVLKHERLPVCVYCGKSIPKGSRARKYCNPYCMHRGADWKKTEERKRKRLEAAQMELENGVQNG